MNLENLAIRQAQLVMERTRLKNHRAEELSKCPLEHNISLAVGMTIPHAENEAYIKHVDIIKEYFSYYNVSIQVFYNCYEASIYYLKEVKDRDDFVHFSDALSEIGCEHCCKAWEIKGEIGLTSRRIGQIRGQITMAGNRLMKSMAS